MLTPGTPWCVMRSTTLAGVLAFVITGGSRPCSIRPIAGSLAPSPCAFSAHAVGSVAAATPATSSSDSAVARPVPSVRGGIGTRLLAFAALRRTIHGRRKHCAGSTGQRGTRQIALSARNPRVGFGAGHRSRLQQARRAQRFRGREVAVGEHQSLKQLVQRVHGWLLAA
jgi:hypothetical protein